MLVIYHYNHRPAKYVKNKKRHVNLEQRPQDPIKFKIQVKQAQQMLQQEHVVTPSEYE